MTDEIHTITYPADAQQRVADLLCDWDYNLPADEAMERAFDIVIDVTAAIDKLRGQERDRLRMLLTGLVEGEDQPCSFDHNGCCQEHGWFGEPGECYTRMAREAVGLGVERGPTER
jgi:hypothetical protein